MGKTIIDLTQALQVTIKYINRMAQHINDAFVSVDHSFETLAETVYSYIQQAVAQLSVVQQAKLNRLTQELADLKTILYFIQLFYPEKENEIWNFICEA